MMRPFPYDGAHVRAVVTTRDGGTSGGVYASLNLGDHVGDDPAAVRRNRDLVAAALGVPALTVADQQHGATCAVVTAELAGLGHVGLVSSRTAFPATDALVTDVPGVALAILVADCAPVLFWDPEHRAVGAAHAGRPGVVRGVLAATVARLRSEFGSDPAALVAGVGPCVGYDSYEVGDTEADALDAVLPGFTKASRPGHRYLDVGGAVERQLADLGVGTVHRMAVDTRTSTDTFFSDRAQRPCGRFMAVTVVPA
ncbi:polyphenol oxidase family protein [Nocardioides sp. W7]|uniref:polyphenol oxidase family protein n=1 Tax=Nocardioides sp. W7 TaxID=2931390 RepID=UPI001FD167DB|nr:polyphenol oxidase family protein [Nocardioides sp. W7]